MPALTKEYERGLDEALCVYSAFSKLGYDQTHVFLTMLHEERAKCLMLMVSLKLPDGFEFTLTIMPIISETHIDAIATRWSERIDEWNKSDQLTREAMWRKSAIGNNMAPFITALTAKRAYFDALKKTPPKATA